MYTQCQLKALPQVIFNYTKIYIITLQLPLNLTAYVDKGMRECAQCFHSTPQLTCPYNIFSLIHMMYLMWYEQ